MHFVLYETTRASYSPPIAPNMESDMTDEDDFDFDSPESAEPLSDSRDSDPHVEFQVLDSADY